MRHRGHAQPPHILLHRHSPSLLRRDTHHRDCAHVWNLTRPGTLPRRRSFRLKIIYGEDWRSICWYMCMLPIISCFDCIRECSRADLPVNCIHRPCLVVECIRSLTQDSCTPSRSPSISNADTSSGRSDIMYGLERQRMSLVLSFSPRPNHPIAMFSPLRGWNNKAENLVPTRSVGLPVHPPPGPQPSWRDTQRSWARHHP